MEGCLTLCYPDCLWLASSYVHSSNSDMSCLWKMTPFFLGLRLISSVTLHDFLVGLAHKGHQGIVRTKQNLYKVYWWPSMDEFRADRLGAGTYISFRQDISLCCTPTAITLSIRALWETRHWSCWSVQDCYSGLLRSSRIGYYSKGPKVAFTPVANTVNVIAFLTSVFIRFGNPQTIVTDSYNSIVCRIWWILDGKLSTVLQLHLQYISKTHIITNINTYMVFDVACWNVHCCLVLDSNPFTHYNWYLRLLRFSSVFVFILIFT